METIKNFTQLFIVEKQTPTVGLEGDVISAYGDLLDGEVAVCNYLNVVQDGASGGASLSFSGVNAFKLIGRVGTKLIHSPLIKKGTITSWRVTGQSAEVQQLDYIGSNGTTGSLDVITDNLYTIRLYIQESTIQGFMQQKIKEGFYKSASSTTQYAVALGLVNSLVANYSREPEEDLAFNRVNDGSRTAVPTGVDDVVFTKGSKYITATDVDDATATAALAVGDLLVVGTATTSPVYRIEAIDAVNDIITLDRAYTGATATIADTALKVILAAAIGNYGIKIQGVERGFATGLRTTDPITWKTTIDFGDGASTTVNETTAAYPGIGTAQQVANLEKELQADNHVYRSHVEGGVVDRAQVTPALIAAGELYDMCVLEYYDYIDSGLGVKVQSPGTIIIAGENSTNLSMSDANQGVVQTIDEIVQLWDEEGFSGTDQDGNLT
jgi:hypothetical protein